MEQYLERSKGMKSFHICKSPIFRFLSFYFIMTLAEHL